MFIRSKMLLTVTLAKHLQKIIWEQLPKMIIWKSSFRRPSAKAVPDNNLSPTSSDCYLRTAASDDNLNTTAPVGNLGTVTQDGHLITRGHGGHLGTAAPEVYLGTTAPGTYGFVCNLCFFLFSVFFL